MGVSPAIFKSGGQSSEHYVPGTYSRSFNVSSPSGVSTGNLCILGKSNGGEPFKRLDFSSISDAQEVLVGGELLDAVAYAFSASDIYIPQKISVMRVNNGTQSEFTAKNGATDILKIKSWDWGLHTNQLKIMIANGTVSNSKKILLSYKNQTETVDDIINAALSVNYYGDGVTPTVTVGTNSITLKAMTEDEPAEETDKITASFDDFDTLDALVTYINNSDIWQSSVIGNNAEMKSVKLDTVTNASIGETGLTLYANFESFIDALESLEHIGKVEILDSTTRNVPDNTDSYIYFTGGTIGSYSITQWQTALETLELEDVQIIATPSTDTAIHSLISTHCSTMSNVINRKERTCILGGVVGMTDDAAITSARGLNNRLVSFCCDNPIKVNLITGKTETLSGAMLGVMLAAMESSMSPNTPLTFKQLNVLGFTKIRKVTNITDLIKAGILVCNTNPENISEYICIRALTTFQGDDLVNNERSMVREDLVMNRDLRIQYKPVIGSDGISVNAAIKTLKDRAEEWALNGYIVPTDDNQNVFDIKVKVNGDKTYITYSRYLTAPVNFVFITAINHIYTSTVEV